MIFDQALIYLDNGEHVWDSWGREYRKVGTSIQMKGTHPYRRKDWYGIEVDMDTLADDYNLHPPSPWRNCAFCVHWDRWRRPACGIPWRNPNDECGLFEHKTKERR